MVRRRISRFHDRRNDAANYPIPVNCPACSSRMIVTELACPVCSTRVQGAFDTPGLHRLSVEQLQFVEVFLRCRGNIKEVERDLKISYPTVRSRLDQVIQAMGYPVPASDAAPVRNTANEVLDGLDSGELTFEDAIELLKGEKQ
ncbi:DUF2089 domain-containing protein [Alicyclobacillus cycloheptanicus]|jgi:hypothetical protein|uniref:DUF2089 domain-containing protein n=1 Tax=Alicyclobacillus cycloheptanicus TaxID=1457 RepID=A0ABT9XEC5_9BACL|nr:DUF2089 domain-containing protein [Alicyclobacillus cycloheptanicus]MDQ0188648.1 hypothetical protein [Alicyclobacillus cycloheptanicus]WDM00677.1 DUF2089 domain-containing protein [Alicyclobacillus cycloheptanicus]